MHVWFKKKAALAVILLGVSSLGTTSALAAVKNEPGVIAPVHVEVKNGKGEKIGDAHFSQEKDGVHVKVTVSGLTQGEHGIHFHEKGKCEGPDFASAGSHFNPYGKHHGLKNPKGPHVGDLPNLVVDSNGNAAVEFVTKMVTLNPDANNSLMKTDGTSLVIHEKADDMITDPAGNSGARIACGVIH
ncbi:superoxide dismutase family protein [Paenibacillus sp. N1-5-1-14]|uniref:superoxide dismutase family protein n=1 Tax=Paenibacillus radicibacter TaxID=2972488 RepID=UPI002159A609|nr:superoxide dismutase family protein [Paenibacillus radicibacter]MCR8641869.1 superoxide dismutase family protein [Paenibacillus radicibacter]